MTRTRHDRIDERGYTLIELLVVISILAIIAPVVANAVILSFRTVGATEDRVTGSVVLGTLTSRFNHDVAGAATVDQTPPVGCGNIDGTTVVHLSLIGGSNVYYTYDATTGDLNRNVCAGQDVPPTVTKLGRVGTAVYGEPDGPGTPTDSPVTLVCGTSQTPCSSPQSVVLSVRPDADSRSVSIAATRRVRRS